MNVVRIGSSIVELSSNFIWSSFFESFEALSVPSRFFFDPAGDSRALKLGLNFVPSYLSVIVLPNVCLLNSLGANPFV